MPDTYTREGQLTTTSDVYRSDGYGWTYALNYTGDTLTSVTKTSETGDVYTLTLTYTGDNLTAVSPWVRT